jgi:UDP-N-acetylmuramyl pentapeptide synthase
MLMTQPGRRRLRDGMWFLLWPLMSRLAALQRRTLARKVRVTAVVGSLGKTTTAHAVAAALGISPRRRVGSNTLGAVPRAILRLRPWDGRTVVEVGIDGKRQMAAMARTVRPNIAVVTSIASEHNRSLETLEVTRQEKADMVRALSPSGAAVLNGDDPNVLWMAGQARARVVTFGFGDANHVRAADAQLEWPRGMRFRLHAGGEDRDVRIRLVGRHMIYSVLAAVAVGLEEGVPLDAALQRLAELPPVPGRMTVKLLENGAALLCDDYKSTLESVYAALDVLEEAPARRKLVALGQVTEPPSPIRQVYRALGARIAGIAQLAVCIDSWKDYRRGLLAAGMPRESVVDAGIEFSRAVDFLRATLGPGDAVLIKGRNWQKLARIALALEGRKVACTRVRCEMRGMPCEACPLLGRDQ